MAVIVMKFGGSLIQRAKSLVESLVEYISSTGDTILIVPGGSVFADTVRKVNPSQEAAHWMAVLAMEQYGYYLGDVTGVKFTDTLRKIEKGIYILLPYNILKKYDELPHTWDVTSDTIAAWSALRFHARFIKVTDVDGIYLDGALRDEINAEELTGIETCIDRELPHFLIKNKMNCEVINGNCPGRVVKALKGDIIGTIIKGYN